MRKKEKVIIFTNGYTSIPKLCSTVGFEINSNKNVIITLTYDEADQKTLIERIIVTPEHMKQIADTAREVVKKL